MLHSVLRLAELIRWRSRQRLAIIGVWKARARTTIGDSFRFLATRSLFFVFLEIAEMRALRLIVLFSIMYVAQRLPRHIIAHLILCITLVLPMYG